MREKTDKTDVEIPQLVQAFIYFSSLGPHINYIAVGRALYSQKGEKQDQSFFLRKVQSKQTSLNPPARSFYTPPWEFYCCNVLDQLVKFNSITVSGSYVRTEYKKMLLMSFVDPELYVCC